MDGLKLAIVTGVWKRPEVFKLFAKHTKRLLKSNIDIQVFVAGSEGKTSEDMVRKEGFFYVEMPNHPLAEKMNTPLQMAKQWGADYVLCVGSDDIITPQLLLIYQAYMRAEYDFIGVLDWYFYDLTSKKALYWGGYKDSRKGATCGAGRVLSKDLLNKWGWRIWENKHNRILDNSMEEKLKQTTHKAVTFSLKDFDIYAFDIKSSTNMTPFEQWPNSRYINAKKIEKMLL